MRTSRGNAILDFNCERGDRSAAVRSGWIAPRRRRVSSADHLLRTIGMRHVPRTREYTKSSSAIIELLSAKVLDWEYEADVTVLIRA